MATQEIPAASYPSRLAGRTEVATETMAFRFERPQRFDFKAGQAIDLTLTNPPETDAEGNTRTFSIASSPFEHELVFATRMRDTAFKRSLKKVPLGTAVTISAPSGSFTLHKNPAKPAVFLAGGIGITPFLSIIRQAGHDRLPHQLRLFYSTRRPEDAAFLDELRALEKRNSNFRLIPTMTELEHSATKRWQGETAFIGREMLLRHLERLEGPIYYIAGPPAMVAAMKQMLASAGADEDDIRTEDFAGY